MAPITNLSNVVHEEGSDNMGGIQNDAYYCLHSEVSVHAAPMNQANASELEDLATVTTDHTFHSGKGWKHMYSTEDAGSHMFKQQGEVDGKSFVNEAKMFMPLLGSRFLGWLRYVNNRGLYVVVKDMEDLKRMIGSKGRRGRVSAVDAGTQEASDGRKGTSFTVTAAANYPAPIVTASISIEADDQGSGSATA